MFSWALFSLFPFLSERNFSSFFFRGAKGVASPTCTARRSDFYLLMNMTPYLFFGVIALHRDTIEDPRVTLYTTCAEAEGPLCFACARLE